MSPISGLITMKSIDEIYEEEAAEARNQTAEDVEKRHSNKPDDNEVENDTNKDAEEKPIPGCADEKNRILTSGKSAGKKRRLSQLKESEYVCSKNICSSEIVMCYNGCLSQKSARV